MQYGPEITTLAAKQAKPDKDRQTFNSRLWIIPQPPADSLHEPKRKARLGIKILSAAILASPCWICTFAFWQQNLLILLVVCQIGHLLSHWWPSSIQAFYVSCLVSSALFDDLCLYPGPKHQPWRPRSPDRPPWRKTARWDLNKWEEECNKSANSSGTCGSQWREERAMQWH